MCAVDCTQSRMPYLRWRAARSLSCPMDLSTLLRVAPVVGHDFGGWLSTRLASLIQAMGPFAWGGIAHVRKPVLKFCFQYGVGHRQMGLSPRAKDGTFGMWSTSCAELGPKTMNHFLNAAPLVWLGDGSLACRRQVLCCRSMCADRKLVRKHSVYTELRSGRHRTLGNKAQLLPQVSPLLPPQTLPRSTFTTTCMQTQRLSVDGSLFEIRPGRCSRHIAGEHTQGSQGSVRGPLFGGFCRWVRRVVAPHAALRRARMSKASNACPPRGNVY